ncbi:MAG: sigma-70 family RNA polymerase sigma factor [Bacteroidetes bacterium]|nr:sigma-70 family RNA polymerase sigma factor [Bacteroidota bacterium]
MTDQDLFEGISEKSNAAFGYLYQNQFGMIKSLVVKKGGTDSDALDIFQEGMIALWMNIQQGKFTLKANTKISTYLYSICNNLWLKKLRSSKKIVALTPETDPVETVEVEIDLGLDDTYDEVNKLRTVFTRLGEKCQKILSLFYYERSSMQEIAAVMNYEPKTAKNEKYRCMKKIRSLYGLNI